MRRMWLLLCGLAAACDTPTVPDRTAAQAYDYRLATSPPRTLRWPVGSTVRVFRVADDDPALTAALDEALDHGIDLWNGALLYREARLARTEDVQQADAMVQFLVTPRVVRTDECPPSGGFAFTTFCLDDSGRHLYVFPLTSGGTSRVKFLVTIAASSPLDQERVTRLVAHELGHVLGIGSHSAQAGDLMYGGIPARRDLSAADRATLQLLYHVEPDITP